MSAGFKVVLADLGSMTSTFHKQADSYRKLDKKVSPPVADSGDDGLDEIIKAMADLITGLHGKLADRIDDNGDKLKYAHDSFHRGDVDVHGVFEDLME